jgi:predicted small secreted protein
VRCALVLALLVCTTALSACNALGGVSPDLVSSVKNAGVSCVRVKSLVMGDAVAVMVNDTKGALVNGTITVDPETCRVTITNAPKDAVATPVLTTTTGTSTVITTIKPVQ